ncbi:hypothetical protein [Haloarchaeobius amylolyticus]|uniref:hypothetical protein n=1 Tax=Haloarchaeobius amylolyticus TaxID=1198296 RepID=UPI00226EB465|nr:hypothetical protein [Haloarchaeobius amylolyticus]
MRGPSLIPIGRALAGRLFRYVTPDRFLGVVTGTILAWNTVPSVSGGALSEWLAPVADVLPLESIPFLLSVLLLGAIPVAYLPRVYIGSLYRPLDEHRSARYLASAYIFGFATLWYVWFLKITYSTVPAYVPEPPSGVFTWYMILGFVLFAGLFRRIEDRSVFDTDHYLTYPFDLMSSDFQSELDTLAQNQRTRRLAALFIEVAGISVYILPAIFFGAFIGILNLYYPLLEVLAILGLVGQFLLRSERTPAPDSRLGGIFQTVTDIDSGFYRNLGLALQPRALSMFMVILFTVLQSLIPLFLWDGYETPLDGLYLGEITGAYGAMVELKTFPAVVYSLEKTGDLLVWFALSFTPLIIVCYSLWFWYHAIRRIPSLLYHSGVDYAELDVSMVQRRPPTSRPVGLFLPLAIMATAWLSQRFTWGEPFFPLSLATREFGFLFVWGTAAVWLCWTVLRTIERPTRPARSPMLELYLPFVIHTVIIADISFDSFGGAPMSGHLSILGLVLLLYYGVPRLSTVIELPTNQRILAGSVVGVGFFVVGLAELDIWTSMVAGLSMMGVIIGAGAMHDEIESSEE